MCGIFGIVSSHQARKPRKNLLEHRGPDAFGEWWSSDKKVYFAHSRLSIIDVRACANQPMVGPSGAVLIFNGEIYNHQDIRTNHLSDYAFKTASDTEVILGLYEKYGIECLDYLRGMFAFALWDPSKNRLFCGRDRFGIKPFYFTKGNQGFVFASEMKALLPYVESIRTNQEILPEYLTMQYTIGEQTLFEGIHTLMPGHFLLFESGMVQIKKYWDVNYDIDHTSPASYFTDKLEHLLHDSVNYHLVSDVPVGSYLSGGIDSSLMTVLAHKKNKDFYGAFHGRFMEYPGYDESAYSQEAVQKTGKPLYVADITSQDFSDNIEKVIYHLDTPVAGPGSFPQYMVSKLAGQHVKVVLGGQGGDEIFGGYARYVIAYFEQSIRAAIEGTYKNGNFIVTPESIIPNLTLLQEYKPLIRQFWKEGLFGPIDERYFRLIDRSSDTKNEIDWGLFDKESVMQRFKGIFNDGERVKKEAYFDKMTHFDFKCLLPALLHVEDRMSMAHGVESRVPFLDHPLIEFAATIPANIKFPGGRMKALLKDVFRNEIPDKILNRRDKMGFPVPLKEWFAGPLKEFVYDVFSSQAAKTRGFYDPLKVIENLDNSSQFSRKVWGLLSLELWHRMFHDNETEYKKLVSS